VLAVALQAVGLGVSTALHRTAPRSG